MDFALLNCKRSLVCNRGLLHAAERFFFGCILLNAPFSTHKKL
jgi:hypothetical protein